MCQLCVEALCVYTYTEETSIRDDDAVNDHNNLHHIITHCKTREFQTLRRESSKRNYYIISPRVIIKAIIISTATPCLCSLQHTATQFTGGIFVSTPSQHTVHSSKQSFEQSYQPISYGVIKVTSIKHCYTMIARIATHCYTAIARIATHCNTLQGWLICVTCNLPRPLQCTALHCDTLRHVAPRCDALQQTAMRCSALQCFICVVYHLLRLLSQLLDLYTRHDTRKYTHKHTDARAHTHAYTHAHTYMHTRTCTHTHKHAHAHTRTHTRVHTTQIYTYTNI